MKNIMLLLVSVLLGSWSVNASSEGLEQWGSAGVWDVFIDHSIGSGCFIQAEFKDGSLVRIGFDKQNGGGYVMALNDAWEGIEDGETYPILFDLDGQEYDAEGKGTHLAGLPGVDIYFDNVDFFMDIANRNVMTLFNENGEVMAISLADTKIGLEDGVLSCQEEVDAAR